MRFYLHGNVSDRVAEALKAKGHHFHKGEEINEGKTEMVDVGVPSQLMPRLGKKQWQLCTTDGEFLKRMYEEKTEFPGGIIIHLLDEKMEGDAIERLFERYKRLRVKRMYTVTPSRVKIRQLPGLPE